MIPDKTSSLLSRIFLTAFFFLLWFPLGIEISDFSHITYIPNIALWVMFPLTGFLLLGYFIARVGSLEHTISPKKFRLLLFVFLSWGLSALFSSVIELSLSALLLWVILGFIFVTPLRISWKERGSQLLFLVSCVIGAFAVKYHLPWAPEESVIGILCLLGVAFTSGIDKIPSRLVFIFLYGLLYLTSGMNFLFIALLSLWSLLLVWWPPTSKYKSLVVMFLPCLLLLIAVFIGGDNTGLMPRFDGVSDWLFGLGQRTYLYELESSSSVFLRGTDLTLPATGVKIFWYEQGILGYVSLLALTALSFVRALPLHLKVALGSIALLFLLTSSLALTTGSGALLFFVLLSMESNDRTSIKQF